jgi:acyl carrier protein
VQGSNESTIHKVSTAFRSAFGLEPEVELGHLEYNSSPEWDSVAHMALVAALEQEFDCMLEMDEILDMSSYARVVEIMGNYA